MAGTDPIVDGASTVATEEQIGSRSRNVKWYSRELAEVPDAIRVVFEQYSNISPEKVHDHIYDVVSGSRRNIAMQFVC